MAETKLTKVYDFKSLGVGKLLDEIGRIEAATKRVSAAKDGGSSGSAPANDPVRRTKTETDQIERLKNQLKELQTERAKEALALKEQIRLQNLKNKLDISDRNSIERAQKLINQYTAAKRGLNLTTEENIRLNENYNKAIAKANAFLVKNADEETKRFKNIGNYEQSLKSFIGNVGPSIAAASKKVQEMTDKFGATSVEVNNAKMELQALQRISANGLLDKAAAQGSIAQIGALNNQLNDLKRQGLGTTSVYTQLNGTLNATRATVNTATNGVGAFSQILRELPAFTYSAQTGILGISNNLPILADEFKRVKTATGSTGAAIANMGKQLFSLGGILTVAVGLFTIFAPEIIKFTKSLFGASREQQALNDAMKQGEKDAIKEMSSLDRLYKTTQDVTKGTNERKKAVDKLQEQYPAYFGNLKDEEILAGKARDTYNELKDAIIAGARARAIESEIQNVIESDLDKEIRLRNELKKATIEERLERGKPIIYTQRSGQDKELQTKELSPEASDAIRIQKKAIAQRALNDLKQDQEDRLKILIDGLDEQKKIEEARGPASAPSSKDINAEKKALEERMEIIWRAKLALMDEQAREEAELTKKYNEEAAKLKGASDADKILLEKAYLLQLKAIRDDYAKQYYDGLFEQDIQETALKGKQAKKKLEKDKKEREKALKQFNDQWKDRQHLEYMNFLEAEKKEKESLARRQRNQESFYNNSMSLLDQFANNMAQKNQDEIQANFDQAKSYQEREKQDRLAQAQSNEERLAIEEEFQEKSKEMERQRNIELQEAKRKQLKIEFALASIKAINAGFESGGLAGAFIAEGFVLGQYLLALQALNAQQFAFSGKIQKLQPGKITQSPNVPTNANGDNVLALAKPGEVVLNKQHQAMLGGDRTFAAIGVPGFSSSSTFGASVQPPVFSSYYKSDSSPGELSDLRIMIKDLTVAIGRESAKKVYLNPNAVTNYQNEYEKNITIGSV